MKLTNDELREMVSLGGKVADACAELLECRELSRWVPVNEKDSPPMEIVLLADLNRDNPKYAVGFFCGDDTYVGIVDPSHWQLIGGYYVG